MKHLGTLIAALLLTSALTPVYGQSPVSVIGAVNPGNCVVFNTTTIVKDAGFPCGSSGGSVSGPGTSVVGDIAIWNNITGTLLADSQLFLATPTLYAYPYPSNGCIVALCANNAVTGTSAGQVVPLLNGNNVWQASGAVPEQWVSTSGITTGVSPSTIGGVPSAGLTYCLVFTSSLLAGSPVTQCYTAIGGDTTATVATKLCAAVIANTALVSPTTGGPIVCDAGAAPNFNVQWDARINTVTVATTGSTGTITLGTATGSNRLDAVFWLWQRRINGYSLQAGDGPDCWVKYFNSTVLYQQCTGVTGTGGGVTTSQNYSTSVAGAVTPQVQLSNGMNFPTTAGAYATPQGTGSISFPLSSSYGIWFGNGDSHIYENNSNQLLFQLGAANLFSLISNGGSVELDYGITNANAWTFSGQIYSNTGATSIASGACGATTNGTVAGTNQSGLITIGSASTTTCTVSYSTTITAPKSCVISPANAAAAATGTTVARVSSIGTTNFVITGSALANANYYYICL